MRIHKNDVLELVITEINEDGYGVVKIGNYPILIENTLVDEKVKVKIVKVLKRLAYGKVLKVIEPSTHRVPIIDKLGTQIGTTPLQHMAYQHQLDFKAELVKKYFESYQELSDIEVLDTIGMDHPWEYRNKAQVPFRKIDGKLETGFYRRGTHDLIPIEKFYNQDPEIDKTILIVRDILKKYHISAYNEERHAGLIKNIIIRRGYYSKEIMVVLVSTHKDIPYLNKIVEDMIEHVDELVSVILNINPDVTNVIMGDEQIVLYKEDYYKDTLLDNEFYISSQSFYQVNPIQTEVLYKVVKDFAHLKSEDIIVDAYCGIGTISLTLAQDVKHVYGVEIVEDAIAMAKKNAKHNNIDNVTFAAGAAEIVMKEWVDSGLKVDTLVVDPPRKGLEKVFIEASVKTKPHKIVYVSCNPKTLARDLYQYTQYGYQVIKTQPVDMFPQTTHVECVALMSRIEE